MPGWRIKNPWSSRCCCCVVTRCAALGCGPKTLKKGTQRTGKPRRSVFRPTRCGWTSSMWRSPCHAGGLTPVRSSCPTCPTCRRVPRPLPTCRTTTRCWPTCHRLRLHRPTLPHMPRHPRTHLKSPARPRWSSWRPWGLPWRLPPRNPLPRRCQSCPPSLPWCLPM